MEEERSLQDLIRLHERISKLLALIIQEEEEEKMRQEFAQFLISPIVEEIKKKNAVVQSEGIANIKAQIRRKDYTKIEQDQKKNRLIRLSFNKKESYVESRLMRISKVELKRTKISNPDQIEKMGLVRQEIQRVLAQKSFEQLKEREYYLQNSSKDILVKTSLKNIPRIEQRSILGSTFLEQQQKNKSLKTQRRRDALASLLFCLTTLVKASQDSYFSLTDNKTFLSKPYERPGSFSFFTHIKQNNLKQVYVLLNLNKNYVHDFDQFRQTGLHVAIRNASYNMVELLLEYNPDLNFKDNFLRTPLYFALQQSNIKISFLLLISGATPWSSVITNYNDFKINQKQRILLKKAKQANICAMFQPNQKRQQIVHDILFKEYKQDQKDKNE